MKKFILIGWTINLIISVLFFIFGMILFFLGASTGGAGGGFGVIYGASISFASIFVITFNAIIIYGINKDKKWVLYIAILTLLSSLSNLFYGFQDVNFRDVINMVLSLALSVFTIYYIRKANDGMAPSQPTDQTPPQNPSDYFKESK